MINKIYVDLGHRNNALDYGAEYHGRKESADALKMGLLLAERLTDRGFKVMLSRKSEDETKDLNTRCREANQWGADLYLCIHRNASAEHTGKGAETLVYNFQNENVRVASLVHHAMVRSAGFKDRGLKARQDLAVLRLTKMVALLIEVGFIDNDYDNGIFDAGVPSMVEAIVDALEVVANEY